MKKMPAYVLISLVFLILTGIGFLYSCFFYPDAHPIGCAIKYHTGYPCASCGFSQAFGYYTHFNVTAGKAINPLSWPVFLFFVFQFMARAAVVLYYFTVRKKIAQSFIVLDVGISISLFLLAFLPLILNTTHHG